MLTEAHLITEIRNEGGYWSVFVNGQRTIDRESFAVADRIKYYLDNSKRWDYSECSDVADSIRKHLDGAQCPTPPLKATQ